MERYEFTVDPPAPSLPVSRQGFGGQAEAPQGGAVSIT